MCIRDSEKTTNIKRGENRNRTLKNPNIVITEKIEAITTNTTKQQLEIPEDFTNEDDFKLIILISDAYMNMQTGTQFDL